MGLVLDLFIYRCPQNWGIQYYGDGMIIQLQTIIYNPLGAILLAMQGILHQMLLDTSPQGPAELFPGTRS